MSRLTSIHRSVFVSLTLSCVAASWWGCSAAPEQQQSTGGGTSDSTSSGSGGGTAGTGGVEGDFDGGGGSEDAGPCTSISAAAERVRLDIVFLIDRSKSMAGSKWTGTTKALKSFFNDPASAKIGAGLSYFPNDKNKDDPCVPEDYQILDVPIDVLPYHAFALANSMPADATGGSSPTYVALRGTLMAAAADQEAHPKRKVIVVLATDGGPNSCGMTTIDDIAALAKSARNYNGVLTYVIGVEGADIPTIDKIAVAGGTKATYDITNDINQFSAKVEEIRGAALGCEFEIPTPPNGKDLDPDEVNFSYTPQGIGVPKIVLRADDLADCNDKPGWYYDSNSAPTKIILCPASCATVQADDSAKVSVLFGCESQIN
jgi:hypothetical protein